MKNLVLGRVNQYEANIFMEAEQYVEDFAENSIWIATPSAIYSFDLSSSETTRKIEWADQRQGAGIVDLQLFYDTGELCACLSNGSILVVNVEGGTIAVNEITSHLSAASWSPDISTLAASDGDAIIFFDRFLELTSMCELDTKERGKDEQVTVGWGSKDTQFQGSIGKAAREKQIEINKQSYDNDSGKDRIKWRADGQFVLISHKTNDSNERHIMIFNNNGDLMSRLKNEKPLEECFAVKPLGNYIATTTKNDDGNRILIFFERNGEKRHEYTLPSNSNDEIIDIAWDISGSSLMIVYSKNGSSKENGNSKVELWTVSNYDWTLKWSLLIRETIRSINWSTEKALLFSMVTQCGKYFQLSFQQNYICLDATVCVISTDGLRMTNFSRALIPPPMSEYVVPSVAVAAIAYNNSFLVTVHSDWTVSKYSRSDKLQLIETRELTKQNDWITISETKMYEGDLVAVVNGKIVIRFNLTTGSFTQLESLPVKSVIAIYVNNNNFIAIGSGGICYKFLNEKWTEIYTIEDSNSYDIKGSEIDILILASSHELYLNGKSVASAVRSFSIAKNVCTYITLKNQIFFNNILDKFKNIEKPRLVEAGSELVTCIPEKMCLTMQMPRGNIETIYPRIFVVQVVREYIQNLKYVDALLIMKKHRINMNILVDLDYETFSANCASLFINPSTADLLDLFIANLSNGGSEYCSGNPIENKVEKVAKLMERSVLNLEYEQRLKFFTVLLSALLKQYPPKAEESLQYIRQHTDEMGSADKEYYSRKWLHHVGFFINEKAMFNAALGTYDLGLTVQVAEASNRDPKEFLPLLNDLRKVEPLQYQKFKIQLLREDWTKALQEISELPDKVQEAISLIKEKNLYSQALRIFKNSTQFNDIARIVASHLETQCNWTEAANLYRKIDSKDKMLECIEKSKRPLLYMEEATKMQVLSEVITQKLQTMSAQLEVEGDYFEAFNALRLSNAPLTRVIPFLSKSCLWMEATHYLRNMPSARPSLEAAIKSRVETLLFEIAARTDNIIKYSDRLEIIRNLKEQKIQMLKEGVESGRDLEDIDAFSEAGSTISHASRKTGRTGTSRASTTATVRKRKQIERKKQSLKEGGEYEDSALLLVLHEQVKWIETVCREAKSLLLCLMELDFYQEGYSVQNALENLCILARNKQAAIWPSKLQPKHLCGPLQLTYTVDGTFSFPEQGGMPAVINIEPEMIPPPSIDVSSWMLDCFK